MTEKDDARLDGRAPEFARMSLRPGLGAFAMDEVASELMRYGLEDCEFGDVPGRLRHGPKQMPLGRYLRRRLRTLVGKTQNAPQVTLDLMAAQVSAMFENSRAAPPVARQVCFRNALLEADDQRVAQLEKRRQIYKERRTL